MLSPVMSEIVVLLVILGSALPLELAPTYLGLAYSLYPSKDLLTVSGEGGGGVMAQIMHYTHSKYIRGVAVYAGTFYGCGPGDGDFEKYFEYCTSATTLDPSDQFPIKKSVKLLEYLESHDLIDELKYLRDSYVYFFVAMKNKIFSPERQLLTVSLYEKYIGSSYYIKTRVQDIKGPLQVIDATYSEYDYKTCKASKKDGTLDEHCIDLSAPADGLEFLLGKFMYFVNPFNSYKSIYLQPLRSFDQLEFTHDLGAHGLDDVGYYYVPAYCEYRHKARKYGHHRYGYGYNPEPCKVHVFFHDCTQGREFKGTAHIYSSNYLQIAEANNIIMLFPQALSSTLNPAGCFDFIGLTGTLYATNQGLQVTAIWRMIARLLYLPRTVAEGTARAASESTARMGSEKSSPEPEVKPPMVQKEDVKCVGPSCLKGKPFVRH